jgi:hypothetical protein
MSLSHPSLWGPYMWYLLHLISFSKFDVDNSENLQIFYETISDIFPCAKCQEHYKKHLINNPVPKNELKLNLGLELGLGLNLGLDEWLIDIHNIVRRYQKKSELSRLDAQRLYWVDNKLPINHIHIWNLLHILKDSPIADKLPVFLQKLIVVFPCVVCRNIMIANKENMNIFNMIKIILDHNMTNEENTLLEKQGFQLVMPVINRDIGNNGIKGIHGTEYINNNDEEIIKGNKNKGGNKDIKNNIFNNKKCWKPIKKIKFQRRL